ncbi:MAG TPA: hypothetical protein VGD81_12830 [Opitutaceae bacterium]
MRPRPRIPTRHRLAYFSGYLTLGLVREATAELDAIGGDDRHSLPVRLARVELAMAVEEWELVVALAQPLTQTAPEEERPWIAWAYALRERQRIEAARAVLLRAEPRHGARSVVLQFNLACYESLLGDFEAAQHRLKLAAKIDRAFCDDAAPGDPDLQPLWKAIGSPGGVKD